MQVSGSGLNPFQHTQVEIKEELRDKPDDILIQMARVCANASKGAEAAAFVRAIKAQPKKDALTKEILDIFGKLDQSSPKTYDAMSSFLEGITMIGH